MADTDNVVVMDGPGPFFFGRLQGPLKLTEAPHADAVGVEGEMVVNETGRRVPVRIPLSDSDVVQLWKLIGDYKKAKGLPDPDIPA